MDMTSLSQGQIYSIVTDSSHSLHPGNDSPIRSFEIIRDGIPETVHTFRGSEFADDQELLDDLIDGLGDDTILPLLIITNAEHTRLASMLEQTDEDGTTTPRTLPINWDEIVTLINQWRTDAEQQENSDVI
ncbi:MAG TPA: hypothetical protein DCZ12_13210 [Gammaproteobacteria bacterium]|nr:hypothetical protein [Gammaproteobacteria bacterium]